MAASPHSSDPAGTLDAAALAALLEASLRIWGVSGQATPVRQPDAADPTSAVTAAAINRADGAALVIARTTGSAGQRPCWSIATGQHALVTAIPSLGVLLRHLRQTLDPGYLPGRALIGHQPRRRAPDTGSPAPPR